MSEDDLVIRPEVRFRDVHERGLDFPEGARVGVILSGGNVDLTAYAGFLAQA